MNNKKHVLITGGAGFIGSNLCKKLIKQGHRVDCVDNLITGRIESISTLRSAKGFRFFKYDITDSDFVKTFVYNEYDEIYHLACPTGVPNIKRMGAEMLKTCSIGTEHALQIASAHGAKLVYASSAEVYGEPKEFPQQESYTGNVNPIGPRSAYEEGKRFSEALVRHYAEAYAVEAKIIRIFNTFGIGMSLEDTRVIPMFIKKILSGEKIVIYGDGSQTRTHLYVDDLLNGLETVMESGHCGDVYNIGGENQLSITDLYQLVRKLVDVDVIAEYKPHFIEDHSGRLPDTRKVKSLGWSPQVTISEGLKKMLAHHGVPLQTEKKASFLDSEVLADISYTNQPGMLLAE